MAKKTSKTKAIVDSVGVDAVSGNVGTQISVVGSDNLSRSLTPKQAYEVVGVVRKAVNAKASDVAKAKLRIFSRRTNSEITSGPLFNLLRKPCAYTSTSRWIYDLNVWWTLCGEVAILPGLKGTAPQALNLLDPTRLTAYPINVAHLEDVTAWKYNETNGVIIQIPAEKLIFARNFSPYTRVRGLSSMLSITNEASANYFVNRFNASFFKNGAVGSMIIRFPKGTRKATAEDFVERWSAEHGILNDNGHKVIAVIGDDIQIETPQDAGKDGKFLALSQYNDERIASLVGIPASVMGFYSKTRFDTIDSELEAYAENTILPELTFVSELLQSQVVDRWFPTSVGTGKKEFKLGKHGKKALERSFDETESDVVVMLDPDSLPIMARLNQQKVEQAIKLREAFLISPMAAAEFSGLEIPANDVNDQVWIPNTYQRIDNLDEPNDQAVTDLTDQVKALQKQLEEKTQPADPEMKEQVEAVKLAMREYRSLVLDAAARGELFDKRKALALFTHKSAQMQVHRDVLLVAKLLKSGGDVVAQLKKHLNDLAKTASIRGMLGNHDL